MFRSRLPLLISEKEHRERRKITQTEIAEACDLSRMTLYNWMKRDNDMAHLDGHTVQELCRYFACSLYDLVEVEIVTDRA